MGNVSASSSPFFNPEYFQQITKKHEPLYGDITIMSSKLVQDYYIAYQSLTFTSKSAFESTLKSLISFKKTPHPNIITLLDFRSMETDGMCSCGGFIRCQVAYEYFSRTLSEDFERRFNQNGKKYSEEEIINVALGTLMGIEVVYRGKVKHGGFVTMETMVIEGSQEKIEKVKVLNPNLNTKGEIIDENEEDANNESFLRMEASNLGVIGVRMISMKYFEYGGKEREEMRAECFNSKNGYSRSLKNAIWTLIESCEKNNFDLKSLIKLFESIDKNKGHLSNQDESFLWRGLEIDESHANTHKNDDEESGIKKLVDISNFDFEANQSNNNPIFATDIAKPIITLNYDSPQKKKDAIWEDLLGIGKENIDLEKLSNSGREQFLDFGKYW